MTYWEPFRIMPHNKEIPLMPQWEEKLSKAMTVSIKSDTKTTLFKNIIWIILKILKEI